MKPRDVRQKPVLVGDTLTVTHVIAVPHDAIVQPRALADSTLATLVGPPAATREGDSVRVAYTIAVWAPGHSDLVLPGAIVIEASGKVDTLSDAHVPLDVGSVLPAQRPAAIAPRSALPWLPRADRSDLPLIVLLPVALIVVGMLQWRWRARGRPVPATATARTPLLTDTRVEQWLHAGEPRLVLVQLEALAASRPDMADWIARAESVRYTPDDPSALSALARDGWSRIRDSV